MRIAAHFRVRWSASLFFGFGVSKSEVVVCLWPMEFRIEYQFGRWA